MNKQLLLVLLLLQITPTTPKLTKKKNAKKPKAVYSPRALRKVLPAECDLTMEVQPLYYVPIIRASTFKLGFSSACLAKREVNFEIYHDDNKHINIYHNPTLVNLYLWGNKYTIQFSNPGIIDKHDIMKSVEYRSALLKPLTVYKSGFKINTLLQNDIFLDPQIKNTFNKYTIKKLENVNGLVRCTVKVVKVKNWKKLKAEAERRKQAALKAEADKKKAMEDAMKLVKGKLEEEKKRAALVAKQDRVLADKDKDKKEDPNKLPEGFVSEPKRLQALMKKEYIQEYQLECRVD